MTTRPDMDRDAGGRVVLGRRGEEGEEVMAHRDIVEAVAEHE